MAFASAKFDKTIKESMGFVSNVEKAKRIIKDFELTTTAKFCCSKSDKNFGQTGKLPRFCTYQLYEVLMYEDTYITFNFFNSTNYGQFVIMSHAWR